MRKRKYGHTKRLSLDKLSHVFSSLPYIKTAFLFGSRATGKSEARSDYDFALDMKPLPAATWGMQAKAWMDLCNALEVNEYDIDVVDLASADSYLKHSIRRNHILLKGEKSDIPRLLG